MKTNEKIYLAALDTFGEESQINMLFEEIADVRIMLDQMTVLFKCEAEVERQKRYKLKRLEQRIVEKSDRE